MKKIVLLVSVLIFSVCVSFAQIVTQNNVFVPKDNVFNLGIGTGDPSLYMTTIKYKTAIPTISASYEHCIGMMHVVSFGLGGIIAYTSYEPRVQWVNIGFTNSTSNTPPAVYINPYHDNTITCAVRATMHYQLINKLDTYCGIAIGSALHSFSYTGIVYSATSVTTGSTMQSNSNITIIQNNYKQLDAAVFIGGRYYVSNSFAINAEVSAGISIVTVGASLKI